MTGHGPRRAVRLAEVRRHRAEILAIGRRFGVHDIRVSGSVARDTANPDSDLDLLIAVEPGNGIST